MSCSVCLRDKPAVARGLCNACYQRWRKSGTTDYQRKVGRSTCSVGDCSQVVVSNGLCDMHRQRMRKHGHIEQTRPDDWGAKGWGRDERHPLYNAWMYMRRHRAQHPMDQSWESDFLQFVADVGERPTPKHKLFSADSSKPIGPQNYVWKRAITERVEGEDEKTYMARAQRTYRKLRQEAFKGYDLKRYYGMTHEEYASMDADHGGKCAICGEVEAQLIRGKRVRLAVDHCHDTGLVRGLLCMKCNTGLGSFKDDPALLHAAISYLTKHIAEPS